MGCERSKNLGPDGYNFVFIKNYLHVLKEDVTRYVKDFHNKTTLSKAITSSFLTLIPKNSNPQGLDEYRPICLVGYLHKILSKLLASRLKVVLGSLIFS